jgi:hypothetical protein
VYVEPLCFIQILLIHLIILVNLKKFKFSMFKQILLFFLTLICFQSVAQEVIIKGKIKDGKNAPLEFSNVASLNIQDSSLATGVMSDLDGNFEFSSNAGKFTE